MIGNKTVIVSVFALLGGMISTSVFGSESQEDQQPEITWKTFTSRGNLSTVQYPSNWSPVGVLEIYGPIDFAFNSYPSSQGYGAQVEFIQFAAKSPFATAKESAESGINEVQNNPTIAGFEIERPVECSIYTLNGLQACSVIAEARTLEGANFTQLGVNALQPDGTEYGAFYRADSVSFQHYLPNVEYMIKSFKATSPSETDFPSSDKD